MIKLFENTGFILALIICNAIVIFLHGFDFGHVVNQSFVLIDNVITVLFVTELILKIKRDGIRFFHSNWNRFDFILVALSLPALIAFLFRIDINDFSFLLVFRTMRVFKSFRFLKFIPRIEHLIRGIRRALKASIVVILGFLVYVFIVGVFSFYLYKESSPEFFSDPLVSLYSTFKIFTIEGWFEIPEQVGSNLSPTFSFLTHIYFIFVVASGGMLGLSLVNSIFTDAMISDNNDELEKKIERMESKIDQLINKEITDK